MFFLFVFVSQLFSCRPESRYPDTVAVTYDPANRWLSCVYNDHSVYVWDIRDLRDPRKAGKLYSALYHSSCVWSLEVSVLVLLMLWGLAHTLNPWGGNSVIDVCVCSVWFSDRPQLQTRLLVV